MDSKRIEGISILHIITRLDRGGSADVVLELAAALKRDGVRVGILYGLTVDPREDPALFSARTGVEMIYLKHLVRPVSPIRDLFGFVSLIWIIRRFRPDIVHTHTSKAGIIGRFAAKAAGVKKIVHTPHGHIFYGYFGSFTTSLFVFAERLAAIFTDRITVLTEGGLRDHVERGIGKYNQFVVIPSCVDIERFSSGDGTRIRSQLKWESNLLVGWAGRLVPIKDCGTFIKAASIIHGLYADCRFVVAGDGEERKKLEKLRDESGLHDYLVFLGDRSDIPDIMAAIDIFVLSSVNEGFGRVLVEAMAAEAAIVSTNVGGTSDVVEDGVTGILVPPSDHRAIAEAVCNLIGNTVLRNELVKHGKDRSRQFDSTFVIEQFEELYAEVPEQ